MTGLDDVVLVLLWCSLVINCQLTFPDRTSLTTCFPYSYSRQAARTSLSWSVELVLCWSVCSWLMMWIANGLSSNRVKKSNTVVVGGLLHACVILPLSTFSSTLIFPCVHPSCNMTIDHGMAWWGAPHAYTRVTCMIKKYRTSSFSQGYKILLFHLHT